MWISAHARRMFSVSAWTCGHTGGRLRGKFLLPAFKLISLTVQNVEGQRPGFKGHQDMLLNRSTSLT